MRTQAAGTGSASLPPWGLIIAGGSAALAVALVVVRWLWWPPDTTTRPGLGQRVGPAGWSFADSWASTVTAFGAILGAVLLTTVLPESGRYVTARTVALLDLIFGFLVVLAPFVYTATGARVIVPPAPPDTTPVVTYEGRVATFLLACAISLWAAVGEVATLTLASAELAPRGALFYVFAAVLLVVAALMLVYAWRSIRAVLEVQARHVAAVAAGLQPAVAARPRWTVL